MLSAPKSKPKELVTELWQAVYNQQENGPTSGRNKMTDRTIDLDGHRGMVAQKATVQRRMLAEVEANEEALRLQRRDLEEHLLVAPAANWHEAAAKARYLLTSLCRLAGSARSPVAQQLIAAVLADFKRLSGDTA